MKPKKPYQRPLKSFGVLIFSLVFWVNAGVGKCLAEQARSPEPLDRALGFIALNRSDLSIRSDRYENPFPPPLFLKWIQNPLHAPREAGQRARMLLQASRYPYLWFRQLITSGDILSAEPLPPMTVSVKNPDQRSAIHPRGQHGASRLFHVNRFPPRFPGPLRHALHLILDAVYTSEARLSQVMETIRPESMIRFEKHLYPDSCKGEKFRDPEPDGEYWKGVKRTIEDVYAIDRQGIAQAGLTLIKAVSEAKVLLTAGGPWNHDISTMALDTSLGTVVIGGTGPDVHETDAALIIDLGGDDLYRGKTAYGRDGRCAVVLDLSGDDVYLGKDHTQGAGLWGVGLLWDLEGDDLYRASRCAQGAAVFGVGLLVDESGTDRYLGAQLVQAASWWGWGGLIDLEGNDLYQCMQKGQAYAGTLGVASLCDLDGDDRYCSGFENPDPREPDMNQSFAQGFAMGMRNLAAGGTAILSDRTGNDVYLGQYFCQGSSYWMGAAVLYDESGKDTYSARRYAQGAGIHFSAGLLLDVWGDDHLSSWGVSQGCGHDYGLGILVNEEGRDTYVSDWLSMGASEANGTGIFVDNFGNDGYENRAGPASGRLVNDRRSGGIGLFVDATGKDRYSVSGADNTTWGRNRWSVGLDTDHDGKSGLSIRTERQAPAFDSAVEKKKEHEQKALQRLLSRSQEMPASESVGYLLRAAAHWGLEKDIREKARERLLSMDPRISVPMIIEHLSTPDILSLRFMKTFYSVHAFYGLPALVEKSREPDPLTQSRALHYLGLLKDTRGLNACLDGLDHASWRVRAAAVYALGEMMDRRRLTTLLPMKADLQETGEKNETDAIEKWLIDAEKRRALLSVLARAVPVDYPDYKRLSDAATDQDPEPTLEIHSLFISTKIKQMVRVLERWVKDINDADRYIEKLRMCLRDPDPVVRTMAAYAAAQIHDLDALQRLISMLTDHNAQVRDGAAIALTLFGDEAVNPLSDAMKGTEQSFRIIALDVLGRIGGEGAKSAIRPFLDSPHEALRRAAQQALDRHE